ncbi:MAG: glycogen/starch/alpha-glucan family phosphorylase, partial [Clostridia bacterium]|nr:glycogen/starch/alpha-glucan family phosphorylase [Clostridia bacterium]
MKRNFREDVLKYLKLEFGRDSIADATTTELYHAVSRAAIAYAYSGGEAQDKGRKRACYFSAEFLIGRLVYDNLMNLGLQREARELLEESGVDFSIFEDIEDDALGNGGLGRLAACFLDSAATHSIPLDGYGIRYKYGLFKQYFENGCQKETADDWLRFGDPWSFRRDSDAVTVRFADGEVIAVPYDMPVIGYGGKCINKLRLWQSEAANQFDFDKFNAGDKVGAVRAQIEAQEISAVLYPNDETYEGKVLRLKQQYFFSSASLQDIIKKYKAEYGTDFSRLPEKYAIQLNDTHPTVSIPELMRILVDEEDLGFEQAFAIVREVFAYTNHTVLSEALERWNTRFFIDVIPQVYDFVLLIDRRLRAELRERGIRGDEARKYRIIDGGDIHMARLAIYATHSTNGVAQLHTDILMQDVLRDWYELYPERFNNKTNGITQRRWLALSNPALASFITERIGDGWITDLNELKKLEKYADDNAALTEFARIKRENKCRLAEFVLRREGVKLDPDFVFDIQVKRLHEYKRQLLNAFSILYIYFGLKEGRIKSITPTAFIFGAKAASGYRRAKAIIKYINEIAKLVNSDPETNGMMQVVFVSNYNVSYAEKLMPAADISEQISTAGREASGTGNMKFMLGGAVTLGTYDGANIEIVQQAGEEYNYIFGARVEYIDAIA